MKRKREGVVNHFFEQPPGDSEEPETTRRTARPLGRAPAGRASAGGEGPPGNAARDAAPCELARRREATRMPAGAPPQGETRRRHGTAGCPAARQDELSRAAARWTLAGRGPGEARTNHRLPPARSGQPDHKGTWTRDRHFFQIRPLTCPKHSSIVTVGVSNIHITRFCLNSGVFRLSK